MNQSAPVYQGGGGLEGCHNVSCSNLKNKWSLLCKPVATTFCTLSLNGNKMLFIYVSWQFGHVSCVTLGLECQWFLLCVSVVWVVSLGIWDHSPSLDILNIFEISIVLQVPEFFSRSFNDPVKNLSQQEKTVYKW